MKRILTGAAALRREDRLQQREDRLSTKNADLKAEIERLRALVEEAYEEGWDSARYGSRTDDDDWLTSNARAALQPKEGDQ
jgi:hypothetical protein